MPVIPPSPAIPDSQAYAPDRQVGAQLERFGALRAQGWHVARMGITAADAALTLALVQRINQAHRVQWLVLVPPGVTDYDVTLGRGVFTDPAGAQKESKGLAVGLVVVDSVTLAITGDHMVYQRPERDLVGLAITNITGAPTPWADVPGVRLFDKPVNPDATPTGVPTGFIIMYRRADRE